MSILKLCSLILISGFGLQSIVYSVMNYFLSYRLLFVYPMISFLGVLFTLLFVIYSFGTRLAHRPLRQRRTI